MNQQSESRRERVVVALDASANSRATLRAAAQLALQLQAELEGLFIEDDNLLRLCNLPFSQEVGLFSATARRLDSGAIEREFRGVARSLQQLIASIAEPMQLPWSFRVTRGRVAEELLSAAEQAQLLSLGSKGHSRGDTVGSVSEVVIRRSARPVLVLGQSDTPLSAFTLIDHASPSGDRALDFALRLAQRTDQILQILIPRSGASPSAERLGWLQAQLAQRNISAQLIQGGSPATLTRQLGELSTGTLILPTEFVELIRQVRSSVIVVP